LVSENIEKTAEKHRKAGKRKGAPVRSGDGKKSGIAEKKEDSTEAKTRKKVAKLEKEGRTPCLLSPNMGGEREQG